MKGFALKGIVPACVAAVCLVCGAETPDGGRLVAAQGYGQPKSAEHIPVLGRTCYSMYNTRLAMQELLKVRPDLAMFDHPLLLTSVPLHMNDFETPYKLEPPKDPWTNFPARITEVLAQKSWQKQKAGLDDFVKRWPGHPYLLSFKGRGFPQTLREKPFDTDRADFAAWRKANPSFVGFYVFDEYDNVVRTMSWYVDAKVHDEQFLKRLMRQYMPVKAYGFPRQWLDVDYEKLKSYHFGCEDMMALWSCEPAYAHQFARKGVKFLFYESEHGGTSSPWRWGGAYTRGAARQFHIPFGWYSAMFSYDTRCRDGSSPKGKQGVDIDRDSFTYWPNPAYPKTVTHLGASRSLLRRNVRYGYFIGGLLSEIECSDHSLYATAADGKTWTLSPYGEDYNALCEWQRHRERGSVYAPVAFLTSIDETLHRQFYNLLPAKDEATIPAFLLTLVPTLTTHPTQYCESKLGKEGCLWNSEFGEIADIVCPDAEQPHEVFRDFLSDYKAAFLIGYHNWKTADREALDEYAAGGGTLFCSYDQIADRLVSKKMTGVAFGSETVKAGGKLLDGTGAAVEAIEDDYTLAVGTPAGARPLLRDENGAVVAWVNDYGRGRVVTVAARRMMPDSFKMFKEDGWKHHAFCGSAVHKRMTSGTMRFPIVHHLLKRVQDETMPIRVEGDIQWGLNRVKGLGQRSRSGEGLGQRSRSTEEESNIHCSTSNLQPSTSSSWLLWLINNKGITKFAFEPEDIDLSKTSTVTVDLKDLKGAKVYDITDPVKTVPLEVKDGRFSVRVKPGEDVRISIVP